MRQRHEEALHCKHCYTCPVSPSCRTGFCASLCTRWMKSGRNLTRACMRYMSWKIHFVLSAPMSAATISTNYNSHRSATLAVASMQPHSQNTTQDDRTKSLLRLLIRKEAQRSHAPQPLRVTWSRRPRFRHQTVQSFSQPLGHAWHC